MLGFLHALFLMVSYWQSSIMEEYYLRLNDLCLFRRTQVQITWYKHYSCNLLQCSTWMLNPNETSQVLSTFPPCMYIDFPRPEPGL